MTTDNECTKLAVSRDGSVVTIEIRCMYVKVAQELYDEVCAGARAGFVGIKIGTVPRETIDVP